jgi:hypothetical protein
MLHLKEQEKEGKTKTTLRRREEIATITTEIN